jgi:CPA1 family monovalent cation:H+ antiporter
MLNSLVFLLLGLQLPGIFTDVWTDGRHSHTFLVLVVLIVSAILLSVRFLAVMTMAWKVTGSRIKEKLKNSLVFTLAGVKGTCSLAVAFSLPAVAVFPERHLILFITAGVIMFTLVAGITLLPVVADSAGVMRSANILRYKVINESLNQLLGRENAPDKAVIINMQKRLEDLEFYEYAPAEKRVYRQLKKRLFDLEMNTLKAAAQTGNVPEETTIGVKRLLFLVYRQHSLPSVTIKYAFWAVWMNIAKRGEWAFAAAPPQEQVADLTGILQSSASVVKEYIETLRGEFPGEMLDKLIRERESLSERIERSLLERFINPEDVELINYKYAVSMLQAFYVERKVIHKFFASGEITREEANEMRLVVNSLESYILTGLDGDMEKDAVLPEDKDGWRPELLEEEEDASL